MEMKEEYKQGFLSAELYQEDYAYVHNLFFIPVAAHLDDHTLVSAGDQEYIEIAGINYMKVVDTVEPVVGTRTTSLPGNHGIELMTDGETLGQWIARVKEKTGRKVVGVTIVRRSCNQDPKFYFDFVNVNINIDKIKEEVIEKLRSTDNMYEVLDCARAMEVDY